MQQLHSAESDMTCVWIARIESGIAATALWKHLKSRRNWNTLRGHLRESQILLEERSRGEFWCHLHMSRAPSASYRLRNAAPRNNTCGKFLLYSTSALGTRSLLNAIPLDRHVVSRCSALELISTKIAVSHLQDVRSSNIQSNSVFTVRVIIEKIGDFTITKLFLSISPLIDYFYRDLLHHYAILSIVINYFVHN